MFQRMKKVIVMLVGLNLTGWFLLASHNINYETGRLEIHGFLMAMIVILAFAINATVLIKSYLYFDANREALDEEDKLLSKKEE